ncbi:unnamed protein product, partial [marine sediment metagenome]
MVLIFIDISTIKGIEKDALIASAILRDLCQYGLNDEFEHSCKDHPSLVKRLAEEHSLTCDNFYLIMRIIENHMGRWGYPQFIPHISLDGVLHFADNIEAKLPEV